MQSLKRHIACKKNTITLCVPICPCLDDIRCRKIFFYLSFMFPNRYANELRYALIYAVFVTPIEVEIFHMPHTVRVPRQIKFTDPEGGSSTTAPQSIGKSCL